jgi:hypothetical protein
MARIGWRSMGCRLAYLLLHLHSTAGVTKMGKPGLVCWMYNVTCTITCFLQLQRLLYTHMMSALASPWRVHFTCEGFNSYTLVIAN